MKILFPVAVVLVAAVPCWYAWQAKDAAAERRAEQEVNEEMGRSYDRHMAVLLRDQWQDERMALIKRHEIEREEMKKRHEREALADRISENLRPGSTRHHGTKAWDESTSMWKRQEEEMRQWERSNPEP